MKINRECVRKALREGFQPMVLYKDPSMDLLLNDVISIENATRVEFKGRYLLIFKY